MRIAPAITLSSEESTGLESQARSRFFPVRVAERARIVLFAWTSPRLSNALACMDRITRLTTRLLRRWFRSTKYLGSREEPALSEAEGICATGRRSAWILRFAQDDKRSIMTCFFLRRSRYLGGRRLILLRSLLRSHATCPSRVHPSQPKAAFAERSCHANPAARENTDALPQ